MFLLFVAHQFSSRHSTAQNCLSTKMQLFTLFALIQLALSAPTGEEGLATLNLRDSFTGTYIVKLKDTISTAGAGVALALLNGEPENVFTEVLNGFSAKLDQETLEALRRHPDVSSLSSSVRILSLTMPCIG